MNKRWPLLCLCAALFGCGTSVKDVCEQLEKDCGVSMNAGCEADGSLVQSKADTANCSDQFDAYLDCLDAKSCLWKTECSGEVQALEACGVSLVPE